MSLKKDEVVELVEKDDNGWWLVKKNGVEGWAPNNYLELVPKASPAPPAPAPPPRKAPPPKVDITPSAASTLAKPVPTWKKTNPNSDASLVNSRPPSSLSSKTPPPVAAKPKPPAVGAKPLVGKPAVPTALRPVPAATAGVRSSATKPPTAPGQVDLAAAVSPSSSFCYFGLTFFFFQRSSRNVLKE